MLWVQSSYPLPPYSKESDHISKHGFLSVAINLSINQFLFTNNFLNGWEACKEWSGLLRIIQALY